MPFTTLARPTAEEHAPYYGRYIALVKSADAVEALITQIGDTSSLLDTTGWSAGGPATRGTYDARAGPGAVASAADAGWSGPGPLSNRGGAALSAVTRGRAAVLKPFFASNQAGACRQPFSPHPHRDFGHQLAIGEARGNRNRHISSHPGVIPEASPRSCSRNRDRHV